jgi:hypothetical protein
MDLPPATPIKVTSGYHATGALPTAAAAKLEPAAYPGALPKSLGFVKDIGNMNTSKVAALEALDAARTFHVAAGSSVEQAVVAASLLAEQLPARDDKKDFANMADQTGAYAVLDAGGGDLFVTPIWDKNPAQGHKTGVDVDWRAGGSSANEGRGVAARATDASFLAVVGKDRWIDVRGTLK